MFTDALFFAGIKTGILKPRNKPSTLPIPPRWSKQAKALYSLLTTIEAKLSHEKAHRNPDQNAIDSLKLQKDEITARILKEGKRFRRANWSRFVAGIDARTSSHQMWGRVNALRRASENKQMSTTTVNLIENGEPLTNPVEKLSKLANQYAKIQQPRIPCSRAATSHANFVTSSVNKFPEFVTRSPGSEPHQNNTVHRGINSPLQRHELTDALKRLSKNTSPGLDHVSNSLILAAGEIFHDRLFELFQLSWETGIFPATWKRGIVIPIPKKTPATTPADYRPITLLPCLGKLLETVINTRLQHHLEQQNLISDSQFGFRSGRSAPSLLTLLTQSAHRAWRRKRNLLLCSLDVEKAFDTVWHTGLIWKLRTKAEIHGRSLQWFRSYLNGRSSRVRADGYESEEFPLSAGLPQGGVLPPTLFIIYVNDLPKYIQEAAAAIRKKAPDVKQYADDTSISLELPRNPGRMKRTISFFTHILGKVKKWFEIWLLTLAESKTVLVLFTPSQNQDENQNGQIRDQITIPFGRTILRPQKEFEPQPPPRVEPQRASRKRQRLMTDFLPRPTPTQASPNQHSNTPNTPTMIPAEPLKYLGLYLDNHLNFDYHVKELRSRVLSRLAVLSAISNPKLACPRQTKKLLYTAWIRPVMNYAASAWIGVPPSTLKELNQVQTTAAKLILGISRRASNAASEIESGLKPLELHRYISSTALLTNMFHFSLPQEWKTEWKKRSTTKKDISLPEKRGGPYIGGRNPSPFTVMHAIFKKFQLPTDPAWYETKLPIKSSPPWKPPAQIPLQPPLSWPTLGSASSRTPEQKSKAEIFGNAQAQLAKTRAMLGGMVIYTDGSANPPKSNDPEIPDGGAAAAAHVLIYPPWSESRSLNAPPTEDNIMEFVHKTAGNNEAESWAIVHALRKAREYTLQQPGLPITILSDSQTVVEQIHSPIIDRTTDRSLPTSIAQQLVSEIAKVSKIFIDWVPGHANIPGNDKADQLAKFCLIMDYCDETEPRSPTPVVTSSSVKYNSSVAADTLWTAWWEQEKTARSFHLRCQTPSARQQELPTEKHSTTRLQRRVDLTITMLRMGINYSQKTRHAQKLRSSPACVACNAQIDDRLHLFLHCPSTQHHRTIAEKILENMDPPRKLEDLLAIPTWSTEKDRENGLQVLKNYIADANLAQLSYRDYQPERDLEQSDTSQEDIP